MMRRHVSPVVAVICALGLSACDSAGGDPVRPTNQSPTTFADAAAPGPGQPEGGLAGEGDGGASGMPEIARSTRSSLQWKRYAAFENDLSEALSLPKDELCNEFGTEPCIQRVHLSPLGGHNPFTSGILESPADPLVTTSTVVERVVLSACLARVEQDKALGKAAVVFAPLDLSAPLPAPDSSELRTVINTLYRRFLARDAEQDELNIVASLARDESGQAVSAVTFAATACLAVGSSTEFLFF